MPTLRNREPDDDSTTAEGEQPRQGPIARLKRRIFPSLGTGMAERARKKLQGRKARLDRQIEEDGG